MNLSNYSGRKYLVEVHEDRVLLDGEVVAYLHRSYEGGPISYMAQEFKECLTKENDRVWQKVTPK